MDYEKKYKEALERARVWKDKSGMPADKQGILDDIFPELAGSEDERIRKELIFYLDDMPEDTELRNGVTNRDVLVWLEKQSEQKSQRMISAEAKEAMYGKPAWSEENEKMFADACIMLDWYQGNNWWKAQHIKNWLKAIKQRIGG